MMLYIKKYMLFACTMIPTIYSTNIKYYSIADSECKIIIMHDDLLNLPFKVDAIVNAANPHLVHAGGVARAISQAAGKELQDYSTYLVQKNGPLDVGNCTVTPAFNIMPRAQHIIHTVGPDCRNAYQNNHKKDLLAQAYQNTIKLAIQNGYANIAVPAISTAIFAYPVQDATPVALHAIMEELVCNPSALKELYLVLYDQSTYDVYCSIADVILKP